MKKMLLLLAAAAMLVTGSDLFAGGIDNNSNLSAEYIRSFTRNGSTDSADIAAYNPAGLVKLGNGLSINFSNQFIVLYDWTIYSNDGIAAATAAGGQKEYKSEEPVYFFPNTYISFKQDNWAVYLAQTVPGGGGSVNFKDGVPMFVGYIPTVQTMIQYMQSLSTIPAVAANAGSTVVTRVDGSVEATKMSPAITLGGAFAVNEVFSVALGVRAVKTMDSIKAKATYYWSNAALSMTDQQQVLEIDSKQNGMGFGGIVGFNLALEGANIAIRYESNTKIELENDSSKDDLQMFPDGEKYNHDLPAVLALGAEIKVTPELGIGLEFNYYFEKKADWDGGEKYIDNSWEGALSLGYKVTPTMLISLGYNYSKTGANEKTLNDLGFSLDSHSIAAGVKFSASEFLDVNAGFSTTRYVKSPESKNSQAYDPTTNSGNQYLKLNYIIALGVNYRIGI